MILEELQDFVNIDNGSLKDLRWINSRDIEN